MLSIEAATAAADIPAKILDAFIFSIPPNLDIYDFYRSTHPAAILSP
jgi:hypothetical protein